MSQLVTGEAVALDLQPAGVPSRVVAAALDYVVQGLVFLVFMFAMGLSGADSEAAVASFTIAGMVAAFLGYPVVMETAVRGRTLGKMAMGIRVVRDDGGPITIRHALVRALIGFFVERPGITMGSAAVICAVLNSRSKRLGDLAAGTMVVQERVASPRQTQVEMPPPLAAWAATLDLSQLSDELVQRARAFLTRWSSLTPAAQHEIGARLATEVAAVVAPGPPPGVPAWAYLAAVVAEHRRRAFGEAPWLQQGYPPPGYGGPVPPGPAYPPPPGVAGPPPGFAAPPPASPEQPPSPFAPPS